MLDEKEQEKPQEEEESYLDIIKRLKNTLLSLPNVPKDDYYEAPIVKKCYQLTMSALFQTFIMLIIVLNTLILAMDKYPAHPKET